MTREEALTMMLKFNFVDHAWWTEQPFWPASLAPQVMTQGTLFTQTGSRLNGRGGIDPSEGFCEMTKGPSFPADVWQKAGKVTAEMREQYRAAIAHATIPTYGDTVKRDDVLRWAKENSFPIPQGLDVSQVKAETPPIFAATADFRTVVVNGTQFELTSKQAAVVQALHENHPLPLAWETLQERAGVSDTTRLRDLFRSAPNWHTLLCHGQKKGTWKLNID